MTTRFHPLHSIRLKHKLFLSYLLVIIIPIAILGVYSEHQSNQLLDIQAVQAMGSKSKTIIDTLSINMQQHKNTASSITYSNSIMKILSTDYVDYVNLRWDLKQHVEQQMNSIKALNKAILEITIYTNSKLPEYGTEIASVSRVENEPWYKKALLYQTPVWEIDGSNIIFASRFPKNFDKKKIDVLYMKLDYRSFFEAIDIVANETGVVISDTEGDIVYSNLGTIKNRYGISDIHEDDIIQSEVGLTEIGSTEVILLNNAIPESEWSIRTFVPKKVVSPSDGNIMRTTLLLISVCTILLLLISLLFSNRITRRINILIGWMRRVKRGELHLKIQNTSKDEISQLTDHFVDMLERVNLLIQEAYANKIIQKEAELRALQSQINPHFLYNTLSLINFKAIEHDEQEISHVVTSLSKFYRTALNKGDQNISIHDELENIRSYLEIVQMMKDYSFDIHFNIDERVYNYNIINLILQPLVENAIEHGLDKLEERRGELIITALLENNSIQLTVEDNGVGISPEQLDLLLTAQTNGYGLKNVNDRIQLKYGDAYGVTIQSTVGSGTVMKVTIPRTT
ncbi:sensor histidine kinase [Paenibacillus faecalis]|uniref:sensor histidine kinase n=1 Tax=Paenibacillus faecalis TaxID=2079532 RepID=UPI000D0FFF92|nr:histidine kinase [Paenibacillus faecalis]